MGGREFDVVVANDARAIPTGALSAARNFIAGEGVEQIREELGKELH